MIGVARRKAEALALPATFHTCDTLEVPHALDGTANLVYTGRGALPWMMDVGAWAQVVKRLLKPGGKLYVFEGHPLDWVWDMEASEYRLDSVRGDYFSEQLTDQRWPNPLLHHLKRKRVPAAQEPDPLAQALGRRGRLGEAHFLALGGAVRFQGLEDVLVGRVEEAVDGDGCGKKLERKAYSPVKLVIGSSAIMVSTFSSLTYTARGGH